MQLREWEARAVSHLGGPEIDLLMAPPDEEHEFDQAALPEQRWRGLRRILLARKGLR